MKFSVFTQAFKLNEPYRFDIDYFICRLIIDCTAVDRLRRFIYEFYIQDLRIYLLYTVTLSVTGQSVDEYRNICPDESPYQIQLIVLFYMIRSSWICRSGLCVIFSKKLINKAFGEISFCLFAAEPGKQRPSTDQQLVDLIVIPADRLNLEKYLFS